MEYKPCPFCGSIWADITADYNRKIRTYFVRVECPDCGAQTRAITDCNAPEDVGWNDDACRKAKELWNARDTSRR